MTPGQCSPRVFAKKYQKVSLWDLGNLARSPSDVSGGYNLTIIG